MYNLIKHRVTMIMALVASMYAFVAVPIVGACDEVRDKVNNDIALFLPFRPGEQYVLTQGYCGYSHTGYELDFGLADGTVVSAMAAGTVSMIFYDSLGGNVIRIESAGIQRTYWTSYLHLSKVLVQVGQKVKVGDQIALSGNTGSYTTGAHLHVQVRTSPTTGSGIRPVPMTGTMVGSTGVQLNAFTADASYRSMDTGPVFKDGDRVRATVNLNLRSTPNGSIMGAVAANSLGRVVGSYVDSNNYRWWKLRWDSMSSDYYSAQPYLMKDQAAVVSQVTWKLEPGVNIVSSPLDHGNMTLAQLLGGVLGVFPWVFKIENGQAVTVDLNKATLRPNEGLFVVTDRALEVSLTGQLTDSRTTSLPPGISIVGSPSIGMVAPQRNPAVVDTKFAIRSGAAVAEPLTGQWEPGRAYFIITSGATTINFGN